MSQQKSVESKLNTYTTHVTAQKYPQVSFLYLIFLIQPLYMFEKYIIKLKIQFRVKRKNDR